MHMSGGASLLSISLVNGPVDLDSPPLTQVVVMQMLSAFAQVVVELPLTTSLDYHIPAALQTHCCVGQRVLVPVGNRQLLGYIVSLSQTSAVANPRDIQQILDDTPLLTPELLQLTQWVADYYMCPWGLVVKAAIPEGFRVRSTAVYSLTPEAQQYPARWPTGRARDILACLADHGTQQQHELEDKLAVRQLGALLRRLVSEGFIQTSQHLLPPKARQRLVSVVRLQQAVADARNTRQRLPSRAPTQAAVLALLHDQDTWELSALRTAVPGAAAAVKRLAQQGIVTISQEEQFRRVVPSLQKPQAGLPGPQPSATACPSTNRSQAVRSRWRSHPPPRSHGQWQDRSVHASHLYRTATGQNGVDPGARNFLD